MAHVSLCFDEWFYLFLIWLLQLLFLNWIMISGRISRKWSSVCHIANRIGTEAYPSGIKIAIFRGNETHGFEGKKIDCNNYIKNKLWQHKVNHSWDNYWSSCNERHQICLLHV